MKNYFILHGSFSNPESNWFPWLRQEIESTKPTNMEESICYVPHFPTGIGFQNYYNWERVLASYVDAGLFGRETIVFAHSIAPAFVCKFLIRNKIKVKKLVFVCGFNNYIGVAPNYDKVNKSMFCENIENVKNFCKDITCIFSDNDPYVNFSAEKEFADKVADKQIVVKNGGHLNSAFGYDKFIELKEFI
jgi:hypothetical protein